MSDTQAAGPAWLTPVGRAIAEHTMLGDRALANVRVRRELSRREAEWNAAGMTPERVDRFFSWFRTVHWTDVRSQPGPVKLMHLTSARLEAFLEWERQYPDGAKLEPSEPTAQAPKRFERKWKRRWVLEKP